VGSPVSHSLSPVLHAAAYAALGLTGWSYGRQEVPAGALARHVARLGPEWVGLSVTMPGKEEALALACAASAEAQLAGAANTLLRRDGGWFADNTDVHGLAVALQESGAGHVRRAVVLGGGATARSAVLALRRLGAKEIDLTVRDAVRPLTRELLDQLAGDPAGPRVRVRALADGIPLDRNRADVVVGTLPAGAPAPHLLPGGSRPPVVLDVVYSPWPSPLAAAVASATAGRVVAVRGTTMLLHQAARQVELMTGCAPPVPRMRLALQAALEEERG
jgi:shikimate dehydrogenase